MISNPDKTIDELTIYSALIDFGISNDQGRCANTKRLYRYYNRKYGHKKDIKAEEVFEGSFFGISKGEISENAIKLYIPQDITHLKKSVKLLFDFICRSGFVHQAKIADCIRNDNIVIRVDTKEEAYRIIDFVNGTPYMMEGILKVNPFLPNLNSIGITMDNDYSYNWEVASLIAKYLNELKKINRLDLFTIVGLNEYIKSVIPLAKDGNQKDIYSLVEKITNKDFKYEDFEKHMEDKFLDSYDDNGLRIEYPEWYFEKAVIENNKLNPKNTYLAIKKYIDNDPSYFSEENNIRSVLLRHVKPSDIVPIMRSKLAENNIKNIHEVEEIIRTYLDVLINKKTNTKVVFDVIVNAYNSTWQKYNLEQARFALGELWRRNVMSSFTDKDGYRTELEKYRGLGFRKVILDNIDIDNLDIEDFKQVLERFEDAIIVSKKYERNENVHEK